LKADRLNADLAKADAYDKTDQSRLRPGWVCGTTQPMANTASTRQARSGQ
jgi:hypothetical protein